MSPAASTKGGKLPNRPPDLRRSISNSPSEELPDFSSPAITPSVLAPVPLYTSPPSLIISPPEVLELAGNAARDNRKNRTVPRHIQHEVRNDEELNRLLGFWCRITIATGGVFLNIHRNLLLKKVGNGKSEIGSSSQAF
ncbi:histone superfamily protein [Actinidia rufa]|uniref:Histone superfamily protein n=1 Tax=Actinidia rufa TaxID=165716 RepID=A0A7J0DIE7_9ERIC|nr:histone superfamily protein [Actinidia rufa]